MSLSSDRPGQNAQRAKSPTSFYSPSAAGSNLKEEVSLRDAIRILRKRRNLILLWAFGCLALVCLYCAIFPNTYNSTATLLVDKESNSAAMGALADLASLGGDDDLKTSRTFGFVDVSQRCAPARCRRELFGCSQRYCPWLGDASGRS